MLFPFIAIRGKMPLMATSKTNTTTKRSATSKTSSGKTAKSVLVVTPDFTLGRAVQIYVKSSSHAVSLTEPKLVKLGNLMFIEGTQVTGKVGHRFEGKRTLVACDNISSLIEFASEDDIWSEPQSKLLRNTRNEEDNSPVLTLHEQGQALTPRHGGHFSADRQRFDYQADGNPRKQHKHRGGYHNPGRKKGNRQPL